MHLIFHHTNILLRSWKITDTDHILGHICSLIYWYYWCFFCILTFESNAETVQSLWGLRERDKGVCIYERKYIWQFSCTNYPKGKTLYIIWIWQFSFVIIILGIPFIAVFSQTSFQCSIFSELYWACEPFSSDPGIPKLLIAYWKFLYRFCNAEYILCLQSIYNLCWYSKRCL